MLTFLPLYFQSAFGKEPGATGLMMLPMVAPLVLVPRLVVRSLAHRFSGRGLLTLGLALAAVGLIELVSSPIASSSVSSWRACWLPGRAPAF
jgi:hypothetical protein